MPIFNDDDLASYEDKPTVAEGIEEFDWADDQSVDLAQLAKYGLNYTAMNNEDAENSAGDFKFNRPELSLYVEDAGLAGVSSNLLDMVKSGFGSIGKFATDNPELTKMFLGGLSAAQKQKMEQEMAGMSNQQRLEYMAMQQQYAKENAATNNQYWKENAAISNQYSKENAATNNQYSRENAAIANQYRIDAENRKIQEDKALWDRRNANITGMGINAPQALTMAQTQPIIDSILKGRK